MSSTATADKPPTRPTYPSEFLAYRRNALVAATLLICCCFFLSESPRISVAYSSVAFEFGSPAYVRLLISLVLVYELAQFWVVGRNSRLEWYEKLIRPEETSAEIGHAVSSVRHQRTTRRPKPADIESKIDDLLSYLQSPDIALAIRNYNDYRISALDIGDKWSSTMNLINECLAEERRLLSTFRLSITDESQPTERQEEAFRKLDDAVNSKAMRYLEADRRSQDFYHQVFNFTFDNKLDQIRNELRVLYDWPIMDAELRLGRQIKKLQRLLAQVDRGIKFEIRIFDIYLPSFLTVLSLGVFLYKDFAFLVDQIWNLVR